MRLCVLRKRYVPALDFAAAALESSDEQPLSGAFRFDVARGAAAAASGQGVDDSRLSEADREKYRRLARAMIEQELDSWDQVVEVRDSRLLGAMCNILNGWKHAPHFSRLRSDELLATLPDSERKLWEELWNRLDTLYAKSIRQ